MTIPNETPLSRRDARQAAQATPAEGAAPVGPPAGPPPMTRRRDRAQASTVEGSASGTFSPSQAGLADVGYRTDVRPRVPRYDAPPAVDYGAPLSSHELPSHEPPIAPASTMAASTEQFRRRDFRPPAEGIVEHGAPASISVNVPVDSPLDYQTQWHAPGAGAPILHATPAGAAQPADLHDAASSMIEQTLSRRELRALRTDGTDEVRPADDRLLHAPDAAAVSSYAVPPAVGPARGSPPAAAQTYAGPPAAIPSYAPSTLAPAFTSTPPVEPPPFMPDEAAVIPSAPTASPSAGSHWSVGIHAPDDPFENTFSREVGSAVGLSNTSALVLPSMPTGSIAGPVPGTGEIIITGMIELSRVVSATGAVPAVHESPDIDELFESADADVISVDSAPVSALNAVSSHTATHSVMTGKKPGNQTVTTVLVASTVIMAVVAIGLFVVAALNGLF